MKGMFREDGGPVFYGQSNRTTVTGDIQLVEYSVFFITLYIAFLIIFPGVRREKFTTFVIVTLSLFTGNAIFMGQYGSSWHVGQTQIQSLYSARNKEVIQADIGVYVGLNHVNVTLIALPIYNASNEDIKLNERFSWYGEHEMRNCYKKALIRGLPFPILTVVEYFSLNNEGFCWGGEYRAAGYYATFILWIAFVLWLIMNLLLTVVPRYGAYAMIATSMCLLLSCCIYKAILPGNPLIIRFDAEHEINFVHGWCYWLILCTGIINGIIGFIISLYDIIYPHNFSTILEVDFDTPYDRHVIVVLNDQKIEKSKRKNSAIQNTRNLFRTSQERMMSYSNATSLPIINYAYEIESISPSSTEAGNSYYNISNFGNLNSVNKLPRISYFGGNHFKLVINSHSH